MIARSNVRQKLGNGNIMLLWGYLTVITSALVWVLLIMTKNPACNWLWFLIPVIGGIATPIMARKDREAAGVKTYIDSVGNGLWTIVAVSYTHLDVYKRQELGTSFKNISQNLPNAVTPTHIYGYVTPYMQSIVLVDSVMFVGLNHYLGENYPGYEGFEHYKRKLKQPNRIAIDALSLIHS